jgi:multiple sugar transport system substrate-binding protein
MTSHEAPRRPARRRLLAGTTTAAALAIVTVGLSGTPVSAQSSSRTTITFDYLWTGVEAQALQKIVDQFNASQDKITVDGVSAPDAQKQLTSMSSSSGSFDISDNFGSNMGAWASEGILAPLNSYVSAAHMSTSNFVPAAMQEVTYKGKVYALPIAVHDFELLYNKTEFKAAGITAPPVTTQQLAVDVGKLTKVDTNGKIVQLGLGNPSTSTTITTLGYAFGGTWDGPHNNTPSPTNAQDVKALQFYVDNITNKYGASNVAKFTAGWGPYLSPQDPFYTGKVAMVIDGEWQPVEIKINAPHLNWGVTNIPYPAGESRLAGTTQLTASTFFIPENSQHKQQAFTFLQYLESPKAMLQFALALGNLPARTSLLDNPAFNAIPHFSTWLNNLKSKNVRSLASQPYSAEYATDLSNALGDALLGTETPRAALQSVAKQMKS